MNSTVLERPNQTYWNITRITEELLHHCEKHGITIWIEFGSLIGLMRHGGAIIPWDYDGDYGMFVEDKERFIETFLKEKSLDTVLDIDYYQDEGCLALHPVDNMDDIVDIIFYKKIGDKVDSLQNDKTKINYPSNDGYCYNKDDLLPLRKTLMLGHMVYYPNNWDKVLKINYGNWYEYPQNYTNYIVPKYLQSPFKNIPEYYLSDFEYLKELVETKTTPFVLKNTKLLSCNKSLYTGQLICTQKRNIYGYTSSITWEQDEKDPVNVWRNYCNNKLNFNIVDSPVDDKTILPNEWNIYVHNKLDNNYDFALTWIMTNAPKVTHFHTDPDYAGGFMKLLEGEKIWWCILPEDYQYLLSKNHTISSIAKLNMYELLQLEDGYLFGKIYVTTITDGDFIWFPINTPHKVITTKHSYGYGGYL
ncbi:putative histone demethylase [Tupanvirus soda lake]|uniref:Histone demethylase n=2 Tax=Tupanvirus TaxID=2094720 RepID=A0AC62AAN1_9VIRU|nr:putative histone demethylase [Tupanvirus soda lake]QKU34728.1 putative histone demethylase [Tupanvirus soda lake]